MEFAEWRRGVTQAAAGSLDPMALCAIRLSKTPSALWVECISERRM
jgi:hypothetical protein